MRGVGRHLQTCADFHSVAPGETPRFCSTIIMLWNNLISLNLISLHSSHFKPPVVSSLFACHVSVSVPVYGRRLSSWFDVDMLACYPSLRALRLSQVPLFVGKGSSEVRPEAIARIPQLQFFNGSEVRQRERAEAEKSYLRDIIFDQQQDAVYPASLLPPGEIEGATAAGSISPALAAAALKQQIMLQQQGGGEGEAEADTVPGVLLHPRYVALMDRYGADMVPSSRTASSGPANLASELVSVTFRNLSFGGNGTLEPITKKLPRSLTVQRLRLVVKQLFGLEPRQQDLSLRLFKDGPPSLLDDDGSSLHYYGVAEGAEIFVNDAKA